MELPKPAATSFVLYCLSAEVAGVVEKETALAHQVKDDLGNQWLNSHSAGNGPYQLTTFQADDHIILDANPHFTPAPATKRIFIRHVKEPAEQLLLLQRGDIDMARDLTSDELKASAGDANLHRFTSPTTNQMYIAGNEGYAPFAKPEVRQALKWAIDYEGIQKNIVPDTYVVNQAFEPSMILGAVTTTPFKHDPDKAKALLAQAGYPQGFTATLDHFSEHPYSDIAAAIQADLAAVGIKVSLIAGVHKQVFTKMRARQHQLVINEWFPDYFDPNSNAQAFNANPDNSDNSPMKIIAWRCHFHDPELTDEVAQGGGGAGHGKDASNSTTRCSSRPGTARRSCSCCSKTTSHWHARTWSASISARNPISFAMIRRGRPEARVVARSARRDHEPALRHLHSGLVGGAPQPPPPPDRMWNTLPGGTSIPTSLLRSLRGGCPGASSV